MKRLAVVLALAAAPAGAQSTADCDRGGVLSAAGIGPLRIGMTPDSVASVCRIVHRRAAPEYSLAILGVRIGTDTVEAFVRGGKLEWIHVSSPAYRTRDSLGVGSPTGLLVDLPDLTGGVGDGAGTWALYAQSGDLCGLVFWLDENTATMLASARGDKLRHLRMRGGGQVVSIDVHGACPRRSRR